MSQPISSEDLQRAIGRLVIASTQLELAAMTLHMALLRSDVSRYVASGQTWSSTYQSCKQLIKARSRADNDTATAVAFTELVEVLDTANNAMRERSIIVHGQWLASFTDENALLVRRLRRWYAEPDKRTWTLDDLDELVMSIENLAGALLFRYSDIESSPDIG